MPINRSRFVRLAAVLMAGGLVMAACGDDDDDVATDATPADVADSTADSSAPATGGETFAVTAVDHAFEGLPAEMEAGDRLTLTNSSTKEVHELVAIKLKDGETRSSADLVKLPQDELEALSPPGPPAAVLLVPPGGAPQINAVGDGTFAEPGRYLITCSIGIGTDPAAFLAAAQAGGDGPPDVPGGAPHFTEGMHGTIVVK